ncbi:hypothetical protein NMY22_g527 [Coprinellus aureogranulatus]|nr:hypothetical protein NMY22_g527 [Coprinellus aureogranulatus]
MAYRIRLFVNALLFPDKFVQRAFEQWMGCRALYEDMEKRLENPHLQDIRNRVHSGDLQWTQVHAHYIQMGGIVFRTLRDGTKVAEPGGKTLTSIEVVVVDMDGCSIKDSEQDGSPFRSSGVGGEGVNGREHEAQVPGDSQQPAGSGTKRAFEKLPASGAHMSGTQLDERWFKDFKEWDEDDIRSFFQLKLTRGQLQDKTPEVDLFDSPGPTLDAHRFDTDAHCLDFAPEHAGVGYLSSRFSHRLYLADENHYPEEIRILGVGHQPQRSGIRCIPVYATQRREPSTHKICI